MKKITFILFALIAGTTFAQTSDATATVQAEIVTPVTIEVEGILNFGKITPTGTAGTVTLSPTNVRTFSDGSESAFAISSTTSVPTFTVSNYGLAYNITTTIETADLTPDTQGLTIADNSVTYNLENGTTSSTDDSVFNIGATLNIPATITAGTYDAGRIKLVVAYN